MSRWIRIVAPFAAAFVTVLMLALVAGADETIIHHPRQTKGKLAVREVRLKHDGMPPTWTIVTYSRWSAPEIWDRGYVMVLLDTKGGPEAEYYLLIRSTRWALEGSLWRAHAYEPDTFLGRVPVWRTSARSVSVRVRLIRLAFGPRRRSYRWFVTTLYTSDVCRRTCIDRVPSTGSVLQWRPGMSPTPSPTPTPSPSGSPSP